MECARKPEFGGVSFQLRPRHSSVEMKCKLLLRAEWFERPPGEERGADGGAVLMRGTPEVTWTGRR